MQHRYSPVCSPQRRDDDSRDKQEKQDGRPHPERQAAQPLRQMIFIDNRFLRFFRPAFQVEFFLGILRLQVRFSAGARALRIDHVRFLQIEKEGSRVPVVEARLALSKQRIATTRKR